MRVLLQENMSSIRSCSTALSNLSYVPPTEEVRASETFNKSGLLTAHRIAVFNAMQLFEEGEGTDEDPSFSIKLKHSVVEMNPPPQLQKIGPILMSELKLGHIHRGSILYGTLCARAFKMTSVMTLLEDDAGHAIKLAIYNAVPSASRSSQVEVLFPEGSKVAIKEPYFKRYKDCTVGLRVDHPRNVVFLTTGHESPLSMNCCKTDLECDALRLEGNRLFAKGHSREAITLYSKSIIAAEKMQSGEDRKQKTTICQKDTDTYAKSSDDGTDKYMPANCKSSKHENKKSSASTANTTINSALLMAYSNRAEAFLRQQMYREALSDAEKALELDNCHLKSLHRKARALLQLKLYNQATACLRLAINVDPDKEEFQKLLVKSISSEQQGRLGSFDLSEYFLRNFLDPVPMCADYMGPVKVQCMPFKHGRGVEL
ncbi:hypothetical protein O6H91_23G059200 [Diphasiastrum complanatum]|uniref:Uncharacterized protein n=1 Tax=Diphasiastrum complanatum TaxID=34168 RepID=A0ACC2ABC6_DIPCM|nr:hypothetical protein O6H91_23G059200 [Diphasiastrum complanatum]